MKPEAPAMATFIEVEPASGRGLRIADGGSHAQISMPLTWLFET